MTDTDTLFDRESIDHLLSTTRAVRKQLDLQRTVPRELLEECLQLALYAPNATNAQSWRWIVVTAPGAAPAIAPAVAPLAAAVPEPAAATFTG